MLALRSPTVSYFACVVLCATFVPLRVALCGGALLTVMRFPEALVLPAVEGVALTSPARSPEFKLVGHLLALFVGLRLLCFQG